MGGPVGEWMEWVVSEWDGVLSRCICAMGGYGDMGIGEEHGHGYGYGHGMGWGTEGHWKEEEVL